MSKILLVLLVLFFGAQAMAQRDSAFIISRNGTEFPIQVKIFDNGNHMQTYHGGFPLFSFSRKQAQNIFNYLSSVIETERLQNIDIDKYKLNEILYLKKDSIHYSIDSVTLLRVENFKDAYDSMVDVNKKYNESLQELNRIATDLNNKRNTTGIWIGLLGGIAAGILVGVAVK